jgi:molecular chaperone GrpE (heat shock protein)
MADPQVTPVTPPVADEPNKLDPLAELQAQVAQAQENERRARADYKNLQRYTQEERVKLFKLAGRELVERLLDPIHHLGLAATQLKDPGLTMVVGQFTQTLKEYGLIELEVMGQTFDPIKMEAVETLGGEPTVSKVVRPGFALNGEVIQVARVVVGNQAKSEQASTSKDS